MAMYNPVTDSFTYYTPVETPRPVIEFPLSKEPFYLDDLNLASVTKDGDVIATPNTPETKNNYLDIMNRMAETHSEEIKDNTSDKDNSGYVSGTYGSNYQEKKGNKQLLIDTIDKINNPEVSKIKGFLLDTAALESGFVYNITSKASTGSGWFGFLDGTKREFAPGVTRIQFNNSPEIQVKAAAKLYYTHLKTAQRLGILDAAKKKGYTTDDVIHAMWLNPTWAKNFFLYGKEGGKDAFGTNIRKYLNRIHDGK